MKNTIALITILTSDVPRLVAFYRDVLGLPIEGDSGDYVEFKMIGVRFAICDKQELINATGHESFKEPKSGQAFELAFPLESPEEVDTFFVALVEKGAESIKGPEDMPWGQRTAFFADPDGNIHELFAELPKKPDGSNE